MGGLNRSWTSRGTVDRQNLPPPTRVDEREEPTTPQRLDPTLYAPPELDESSADLVASRVTSLKCPRVGHFGGGGLSCGRSLMAGRAAGFAGEREERTGGIGPPSD